MNDRRVELAVGCAIRQLRDAKDLAIKHADYPVAAQLRDLIDGLKEACREHDRQEFYEVVGVA